MMTIVGIVLAILSIVISTIMDGNSFGALIGPSSLFLVVVGALGVTLSGFDIPDVKSAPKSMIVSMTAKLADGNDIVTSPHGFRRDRAPRRRSGARVLDRRARRRIPQGRLAAGRRRPRRRSGAGGDGDRDGGGRRPPPNEYRILEGHGRLRTDDGHGRHRDRSHQHARQPVGSRTARCRLVGRPADDALRRHLREPRVSPPSDPSWLVSTRQRWR